jgi:tetratricopeptide (TPR) repeat protein
MAKILALKMERNGNKVKADEYFKQASELAETADQKAEIFYTLAGTSANRGNKPSARKYALRSVDAAPSKKEAYKFIGDLYMTSYNECKEGVSKVQDRAIFIAAYDMYKKAGNNAMMKSAQEQFPSIEEIFELDLQEGQNLTVGCWINESVTIQRRPK